MKIKFLLSFCLIAFHLWSLNAQIEKRDLSESDSVQQHMSNTELALPSSAAFDILGLNPEQVVRPAVLRDVKVDWSMRTWGGKPNIALELQPIWELLYNRANLRHYQRANWWMQQLSTLNLSAGTVDEPDKDKAKIGSQRVAFAAKINLFSANDPYRDAALFAAADSIYRKMQKERIFQIHQAMTAYKLAPNDSIRLYFSTLNDSLTLAFDKAELGQKANIQKIAQNYLKDNWNASHIDVAYGKVLNYEYRGNWDSFRLQSFGHAVWLNASLGLGKKVALTSLVRYTFQNRIDSVEKKRMMFNTSDIWTVGINLRYGTPKFNVFTEIVSSGGNTATAIKDARMNLNQMAYYTISYGGDWRINRNILLSFGVRTDYRENFKFKSLFPTAKIACMMR